MAISGKARPRVYSRALESEETLDLVSVNPATSRRCVESHAISVVKYNLKRVRTSM